MIRRSLIVCTLLFSGCSSPPPPQPVQWEHPAVLLNTALPMWQENTHIIPSPSDTGSWSTVISAFNPARQDWSVSVWYAVAHARDVVVMSPDGTRYFAAKTWLRQQGFMGVIRWQHAPHSDTRIILSR